MDPKGKIYVAGHRGLVGSAIIKTLVAKGYKNIIYRTHAELDLTNQNAVADFFKTERPEYVILAAARVGGIMANNTYRAEFIYDNLQIQNNVIHHAQQTGVKKLLFLGSSCIYPKNAPQPLREDYLLTDELEYTNEPYAIAKIAGIKMCESYNLQYGTNFISVMPTNLYGPNDNFDLEKSHVLPALIRKMHLGKALEQGNTDEIRNDFNKLPVEGVNGTAPEAEIRAKLSAFGIKQSNSGVQIELWGSGNPRREFLHSEDMAAACVHIMEKVDFKDLKPGNPEIRNTHINIGTGKDLSINELAHLIKDIVGFTGGISWNTEKPDGTFQKLLDVSKLHDLGWSETIRLNQGIKSVYEHYTNG